MPFPASFDAFVPSNLPDFFTLAKVKPDYVSFETLRAVPLDEEHILSKDYAKKITIPAGYLHSLRVYYFALAILYNGFSSATPGVPQLTFVELNRRLYHTCILHDLGWTKALEGLAHPTAAMTFEFHGGFLAYEHLRKIAPDLTSSQISDIVQSIMLHTSQWPSGQSSIVKSLLSVAAIFDIGGYDGQGAGSFDFLIHRKTVQEIEKEFPRGNFVAESSEILGREFEKKPDCLLGHFPGGSEAFLQIVRKEPIVPVDE
ncbi:hypothetical protein R3P38DRAFT_2782333 [Favolaschia claudopus]|uniref:HD domain-containing protein n=1 Tax=Favolaschia claudopus TaxID=2862362 RepID=A0AAW0B2D0_9AGAR